MSAKNTSTKKSSLAYPKKLSNGMLVPDVEKNMARTYMGLDGRLAVLLENAAPDLFTFIRRLGMKPANNESKLCCAGWRHTARYAKRWYR